MKYNGIGHFIQDNLVGKKIVTSYDEGIVRGLTLLDNSCLVISLERGDERDKSHLTKDLLYIYEDTPFEIEESEGNEASKYKDPVVSGIDKFVEDNTQCLNGGKKDCDDLAERIERGIQTIEEAEDFLDDYDKDPRSVTGAVFNHVLIDGTEVTLETVTPPSGSVSCKGCFFFNTQDGGNKCEDGSPNCFSTGMDKFVIFVKSDKEPNVEQGASL